jgi:hypothetical protein
MYRASSDTFRNVKAATPLTSALMKITPNVDGKPWPVRPVAATVADVRSNSIVEPVPNRAELKPNHAVATSTVGAAESVATSVVLRHSSALTPEIEDTNRVMKHSTKPCFDVTSTSIATLSNVSVVVPVPATASLIHTTATSILMRATMVATSVVLRHVSALTPETLESNRATAHGNSLPVDVALIC